MARKHIYKLSCCGPKWSPEQWDFYCNGKRINLNSDKRSLLAQLVIGGDEKEAYDRLKRIIRNEEKKDNVRITYAFFGKDSNEFYYTEELLARRYNMDEKLRVYKEWKRYIQERGVNLCTYTVGSGYLTPNGMTDETKEEHSIDIDLNRKAIIKIIYHNNVIDPEKMWKD